MKLLLPSKRGEKQLRRAAAGELILLRQGNELLLNNWVVMKWPNKTYELTDRGRAVIEELDRLAKPKPAPKRTDGAYPCPYCTAPVPVTNEGAIAGVEVYKGRCTGCGRHLEVQHSESAIHIVVVSK